MTARRFRVLTIINVVVCLLALAALRALAH